MNNKQAIAEFADTMLQHFPPFRAWEEYQEKAWADALVLELSGFSPQVIQAAQRHMIRSRKPRDARPPMVSECIDACVEQRRVVEAKGASETLPQMRDGKVHYYSEERDRLADDLMKSELGRTACREGWQLAMWNFCRDNMRHPKAHEIERCKRDARGFDQTYEEVRRASENVGHMRNPILDFARNMLAEREKIKAEVLGP